MRKLDDRQYYLGTKHFHLQNLANIAICKLKPFAEIFRLPTFRFSKKCRLPELLICKFCNNKEVKMCRKIVQKNVFSLKLPFAKNYHLKFFSFAKNNCCLQKKSFAKNNCHKNCYLQKFARCQYCVQ